MCYVDAVSVGTRRGHHIIGDWSYRWLLGPCRFRKLNRGPSEGQPVLLAAKPALEPHMVIFYHSLFFTLSFPSDCRSLLGTLP